MLNHLRRYCDVIFLLALLGSAPRSHFRLTNQNSLLKCLIRKLTTVVFNQASQLKPEEALFCMLLENRMFDFFLSRLVLIHLCPKRCIRINIFISLIHKGTFVSRKWFSVCGTFCKILLNLRSYHFE